MVLMENTPLLPPEDEENSFDDAEKPLKKKKKKRARDLGASAIETSPLFASAEAKPESKSYEPKPPEQPKRQPAERSAGLEKAAEELPLDDVTPAEAQLVAAHIAEARMQTSEEPPTEDNAEAAEEQPQLQAALQRFRERIVGGSDPDEAYDDTVAEFEAASSEESVKEKAAAETPVAREFDEEPVVLHAEGVPPPPPLPPERPTVQEPEEPGRPRPFTPAAREFPGVSGVGLYETNLAASGLGAPSAYKLETVPFHDELILRNMPGGIIGYLIGRRRGRIKTEAALKPIQQKLEKRVKQLEKTVAQKELQLRQHLSKHGAGRSRSTGLETALLTAATPEQPRRQLAPEAVVLHGSQKASERIGHVLISAERPADKTPVFKPEKAAAKAEARRAETMSREDLLAASERIIIEGTTLRNIYETHLIGERGLRRLVGEHLRGGDVKKRLRQEIVEREIDFERDPILRDRPHSSAPTAADSGGAQQRLRQAETAAAESGEEAAFYKARTRYEARQQTQQQKKRRALDISLISIIAVLIALVTVLLLKR